MKNFKIVFTIIFCVILSGVLFGCDKTSDLTTETISTTKTPGPNSFFLIDEEITVEARTNYAIGFMVDADMQDVTVEGKFQTVDGRPTIEAYIMDQETYEKWLVGGNVITLYDSGEKSIAFVDEEITTPGRYQLIFTNWKEASFAPSQQVTVSFELKWVY